MGSPGTLKPRSGALSPLGWFFRNGFGTAHLLVFIAVWGPFTALTYYVADRGLDDGPEHDRAVVVTTLASITGPMVGAISRDLQGCCLEFSLWLLPYCGAFLVVGVLAQLVRLPRWAPIRAFQLMLWLVGLLVWFGGGIVSFGHALS